MQRIARHAFRVDANENLLTVADVAHNQRQVRIFVDARVECDAFPVAAVVVGRSNSAIRLTSFSVRMRYAMKSLTVMSLSPWRSA